VFITSKILIVFGLSLDVIGAAIIAWPDIPRINLFLPSEVLRNGLEKMEGAGIEQTDPEFPALKNTLEQKYATDIPENVWAMRVGMHTASRYGYETIYLFTDRHDESEQKAMGKDMAIDVDYRVVRKEIQVRLDQIQAIIRAFGFILLSSGFIIQIIAQYI